MINNYCGYCQRTVLAEELYSVSDTQSPQPECLHAFHTTCVQAIPRCATLNEIFCNFCVSSSIPRSTSRVVSRYTPPIDLLVTTNVPTHPDTGVMRLIINNAATSFLRIGIGSLVMNALEVSKAVVPMARTLSNGTNLACTLEMGQLVYRILFKPARENGYAEDRAQAARILTYLTSQVVLAFFLPLPG